MKADPNLVQYQSEWTDNIGGMANAIFWLEEHWKSDLNAQGDYIRECDNDGVRWFWNYSPATETILVHRGGTRESFRIDRSKMIHIKDGNEETADYYRPFLHKDDPSKVEWLRTRHVEIVKSHHLDRIPLYVDAAYAAIVRLVKNKPLSQFPIVDLSFLMIDPTPGKKKRRVSIDLLVAYRELHGMLHVTKVEHPFLDHHIHSYWALMSAIKKFNQVMHPELATDAKRLASADGFYEGTMLQMVEDILNQTGDERSAQIVYAMLKTISFEEAGPYVRAQHERLDPTIVRTNQG